MSSEPRAWILRALHVFVVCIAFLLCLTGAKAWWIRRDAYHCVIPNRPLSFDDATMWGPNSLNVPDNSPASPNTLTSGMQNSRVNDNARVVLSLLCPIVDESSFPKTDIVTLNAYTTDGDSNDEVCVAPCTTSDLGRYTCGAYACTGKAFVGMKKLSVGSTANALFNAKSLDMPYLNVLIPEVVDPIDSGGYHPSVLHGYYQASN